MEQMIHRMLTTSIIPQRYATTHLTVFTFRAGQHWSRAVLCDDMQASLQPSEAVVPSYPWRCTIVVFQCARYTRCTRDRGFPHQMWRGSHQRRKPPLIQKQLFRHFLATIDTSSLCVHHVEASSSSSSSSCWGIIDVIKISAIQSLFRNISLSSNIVVLVIKAGIIILGTFSVAKFFRYRYQYFFPTPKFSGRGTFFPGPNFSVSGPILFLDQICPFTGSCSFFRTKFFRYRSRYFFSGPNFSRTGTSTIQKGVKFPGPGILRTGMSHSGW